MLGFVVCSIASIAYYATSVLVTSYVNEKIKKNVRQYGPKVELVTQAIACSAINKIF